MKKVSTGAAREKRNFQEQKLTIGLEPRRIAREIPHCPSRGTPCGRKPRPAMMIDGVDVSSFFDIAYSSWRNPSAS